jgi:hypothetical protein
MDRRGPIFAGLALLNLAVLPGAAAPPQAEPVGNEVCLSCHEKIAAGYPESPHLKPPVRCESCHGDGAKHAETGDPKAIRSFKSQPAAAVCTGCHKSRHIEEWKASRHAQVGVDCIDCHDVHTRKDPQQSCKGCH